MQKKKDIVLVVDDTPASLKVLISYLKKAKLAIVVAQNGKEALQRAENMLPDLILLDVKLPDLSGLEVCQKLKENNATKDIPVIFITVLAHMQDKVKGFEVGGVDYITKPFQQEEVLARVSTHLKLQKSQKQLQQLNATKDKFFGIIAHDLKNPFTGLINMSEFLLKSLDELEKEDILDCVTSINTSSKKAFSLLDNLLQWARAQTDSLVCKSQKVNLEEIIAKVFLLLTEKASRKEVELNSKVKDTNVWADPNIVELVIRNLVTNAVKFTKKGTVTISAIEKDSIVEITVLDTGIGISKQDLDNLFKIEQTKSKADTTGETGTGLGLILCREFLQKNGGNIWVKSQVNKGSQFTFSLPQGA